MSVKTLFSCGTGILPIPWQTGETPVPQKVYLHNWDAPRHLRQLGMCVENVAGNVSTLFGFPATVN